MTRSVEPNPIAEAGKDLLPAQGEAYPPELARAENRLLRQRREKVGGATDPVLGLALSGGGIRSATFSLGVLQALAAQGLLRRIDLLSTVSGGGYLGSFLGGLYVRAPELGKGQSPADYVEAAVQDCRTGPVAWLRENGRYLTPAGSGDGLLAGAVVIRNWAALQWVLGIFVLMLVLLMGLARVWLQDLLGLPATSFWAAGLVKGVIWWSPYVALPLLILGIWVVPVGCAYWLVSPARNWNHQVPAFLTTLAVAGVCVWAVRQDSLMFDLLGPAAIWVPSGLAGLCLLTFCAYAGALLWALIRTKVPALLSEDSVLGPRQRLTDLLRLGLVLALVALGLALVDSFGQTLYAFWSHKHHHPDAAITGAQLATVFSPVAVLLAFGNKLIDYLPGKAKVPDWIQKLPLASLALVVAVLLGTAFLSLFSFLGHGIAWGWQVPAGDPGHRIASYLSASYRPGPSLVKVIPPSQQLVWLAWGLGLTGVICLALGHTFEFLNQSSLGPFYRSMLTRSYLGASNPLRNGSGTHHVVEGDDLALADYAPHLQGGPLHLVNVTLNETCGGSSQVEQKDRHGVGMVVGPGGVTVGVRHCATWSSPGRALRAQGGLEDGYGVFRVRDPGKPIQPEALSIGHWVGISGAALAPGMGSNTALGFSLLLGFFNCRLGHWWRSGVDASQRHPWSGGALQWAGSLHRRLFPIQFHFLDELLAEFPGTSVQHWYLSDGGHFENTGVYELLRRRVPLMILCDCGADPGGGFGDLTNLVRKARVDFGAEIEVLDHDSLARLHLGPAFGTLDQVQASVQSSPGSPQPASALLAAVYYDQAPTAGSILVLLKPGLMGDEPLDVANYRCAHPHFPQEATAGQFFGEAQWESYRRLGEHIGRKVFPSLSGPKPWAPLATALKNLPRRS
jgi:hypothetical protein